MKNGSKTLLICLGIIAGALAMSSASLGLGVFLFLGAFLYFAPSVVAFERDQDNATAILALNLLLGWLLIPWVIALVWALSNKRAPKIIEHRVTPVPESAATQAAASTDTRTCPFCAETVKSAARICKHCRSELSPSDAVEQSSPPAPRGI